MASIKYCVVRILGTPSSPLPRGTRLTVTEAGAQRYLDDGQWIPLPSDGAIGERVSEDGAEHFATEVMTRLARDNPGNEYRLCVVVE